MDSATEYGVCYLYNLLKSCPNQDTCQLSHLSNDWQQYKEYRQIKIIELKKELEEQYLNEIKDQQQQQKKKKYGGTTRSTTTTTTINYN